MATRNFWIRADIDGRETPLTGGPAGKTGGMSVQFCIRHRGEVKESIRVECWCGANGNLLLQVLDAEDNIIYEETSER